MVGAIKTKGWAKYKHRSGPDRIVKISVSVIRSTERIAAFGQSEMI